MDKETALTILTDMPETEFQAWFKTLPARVRLCCRGGLVNWQDVLPEWYIHNSQGQTDVL